jgi:hypothetical protein
MCISVCVCVLYVLVCVRVCVCVCVPHHTWCAPYSFQQQVQQHCGVFTPIKAEGHLLRTVMCIVKAHVCVCLSELRQALCKLRR